MSIQGLVGAMEASRAYCKPHLECLDAVRNRVLERLAELNGRIVVPPAQGALYCLIRARTALDPMNLVLDLIRRYKVAVIPGGTFGLSEGRYLRVAFGALDADTVADGMDRLVTGLRELP